MNFSLSVRTEQQNRRLSRGYTLKKTNPVGIIGGSNEYFILDCFETPLFELEKSFNNLSENFKNIKKVQESLNEFNKAFSGFLYGVKMNAHCVEFSEAPTKETFASFIRRREVLQLMTIPKTPLNTITPRSRATTVKNISVPKLQPTPAPKLQKPRRRKINKAMEMKAVIKKIVDALPQKYRGKQQSNRGNVEAILKLLCLKPTEGLYMEEIIQRTNLTRFRCCEYLNALVNSNHVIKISKKGQVFKLDPIEYANFIHIMSI
ncbi:DASH complex subunit Dam1-domain-containing protein [Glomus cerebriforme]|uniref:DASH complex subunit DAM1 n=1 Tax=Glomus cerebriforme TaxID=658196 RepID=A0A397T9W9_9GLOM|nr:DASH complex subunit Dam1-domain-containing protein [Glomus cerebriforme]